MEKRMTFITNSGWTYDLLKKIKRSEQKIGDVELVKKYIKKLGLDK